MDITNLLSKQEDLLPELVPYITRTSTGDMLQHPLVYQMFYTPQFNAFCNEQYRNKKKFIEEAIINKKWNSFVWMHERPYRLQKFFEIKDKLTDQEFWETFSDIWIDSENLWQNTRMLDAIFQMNRPGKEHFMNSDEQSFLDSLPEEITVYRGHQGRNRIGFSWSLSYWKAKWFSQRFQQKRIGVIKTKIQKGDIFAVLLGRNEFEIVIHPSKVQNITACVARRRPEWIQKVLNEVIENSLLNLKRSAHGIWHWDKVESNALELANQTKNADKIVCRLFAILHDSKRENEENDPDHGRRAADYTKQLFKQGKLQITRNQLDVLVEACYKHNDGQITDDPTIGCCWDADRLDLSRVGIITDKDLLSTEAGKNLLWNI